MSEIDFFMGLFFGLFLAIVAWWLAKQALEKEERERK